MCRGYVNGPEWLPVQPFSVASATASVRVPTMKRLGTVEDRFWSRVEKTDGCWLWKWSTNSYGYGLIGVRGRVLRAHRLSWEMTNGPIPEGKVICHRCDNPRCVNPGHLFVGTHADNVADKMAKGRCPKGENAGPAKLTDAQAAEIRDARDAGEPYASLAARFGVGISAVWQIAMNRTHVDPARAPARRVRVGRRVAA